MRFELIDSKNLNNEIKGNDCVKKISTEQFSSSYCFRTSCTVALQHAKKVVSDSLGIVDFAARLVNAVFNLPHGQVISWGGNSNYRRTLTIQLLIKYFSG